MSDKTAFSLPLLEWIDIPAGQITLESNSSFEIKSFKIAKYPVTNAQFEMFIQDGGYKDDRWWVGLAQMGGSPRASDWREPDCPKLQVCWYEAVAFSQWLADKIGLAVRLPTEWEWQWAAIGDSGWMYAFGDEFDGGKCNTKDSGLGRTSAVTQFANVKTHFDTVDMCGNVWEWCLNEGAIPRNIQVGGSENRVLRGGSWNNASNNAQAIFRVSRTPRTRTFNIGFRLIIAA